MLGKITGFVTLLKGLSGISLKDNTVALIVLAVIGCQQLINYIDKKSLEANAGILVVKKEVESRYQDRQEELLRALKKIDGRLDVIDKRLWRIQGRRNRAPRGSQN